jgi:putative transposase
MKRARFTEDQIIGAKYRGMDVSEAKRLKQLEDENAKLKKLLAEQMLDAAALRELLSKKW